ncbi:N-terminal EF-hand calcium-binding protein 1-like [Oscarella lobularis]|uniref:N-terminal EF-hand calcium-binding protein 1-like n=1 Tax=Oscarella lobularis TaxID=121494 RepID=UPI0033131BD6
MATKKGMSIFYDVFRRADKNDDNALSMSEFNSFFADGVVSSEELEKLFHDIDTDKSDNIDTGELCAHFSKTWGPFGEIFAALEDLNASINRALFATAKGYGEATFEEQFSTRFLMKEVLNQLKYLGKPIGIAIDKIDEQTIKSRPNVQQATFADKVGDGDAIGSGKKARQMARLQSGASGDALGSQVSRLAELVSKLEGKLSLGVASEERISKDDDKLVLVVFKQFEVNESKDEEFKAALKTYCADFSAEDDCLHLLVRTYDESTMITVYEVWINEAAWKSHAVSKAGKAFQHACVDCLASLATVTTMPMPASWWEK